MSKSSAVALTLVALLGSFARPCYAAEDDKAAAKAHFATATRFYDVREYGKALEEYKAAYMAKPDPAFLYNVGQCYRRLGRNTEALDFFHQFLRKAPASDPNRAQVEARIREIESEGGNNANASGASVVAPAPPPYAPAPAPAPASAPIQPNAAPLPNVNPPVAPPAGVDLTAPTPARNDSAKKPIYGTWWFWTGMAAAVAAGTVTAVILSSTGGGTNIPHTTLGSQPVLP